MKSDALTHSIAHALELLEGLEPEFGAIASRKMFGGAGLYAEGKIFAVIFNGELLLKGDDALGAAYEEAGGERWSYDGKKSGKPVKMPYWTLPPDAVDDPDAACDWARRAIAAALKA